jgi:arsenate reductase-like glutaredoxin family protein
MPAPLGTRPTKKMPEIQVFGRDDSPDTRAALRFFRERRVVVHYVDLKKRPIAPGELRRFTERLGPAAILDTTARPYQEQGLAHLTLDDAGIVSRLQADQRLIRLPLARHGSEVTVGRAETKWADWVRPAGASSARPSR